MSIITIAEAKEFLRLDHDTDDDLITAFIGTAEAIAVAYTGTADILTLDPMPEDTKQAIKTGVHYLYDGLDDEPTIQNAMAPYLQSQRVWVF